MARSSRSRTIVALAGALAIAGGARASAHRLDEYLQAARIGIDPARVTIELDLTPGLAVAPRVISEIDTNRDGSISPSDVRTYAARVLQDISADLDGRALLLTLTDSEASSVDDLRNGEGAVRLRAMTALAASPGEHRLRVRNLHHADIGVYLANALVPATDRVAIVSQERDANQREIVVTYTLAGASTAVPWRPAVLGLGTALLLGVAWWRLRPMTR